MLDDIVIRWENDFNQYLGLVAERMAAGEASDEEAWPLVNLERTVAIYELMMENALEKRGNWTIRSRLEYSGDLLNDLADHLAMPVAGRKKLVSALSHALENGFLKHSVTADRIRWQWVDRIVDRKDCIIHNHYL
jgi:hypothetical protein